jgi:predicted PurR-regulated permease PerM
MKLTSSESHWELQAFKNEILKSYASSTSCLLVVLIFFILLMLFVSFCFSSAGDQTQSLVCTMQVLQHWTSSLEHMQLLEYLLISNGWGQPLCDSSDNNLEEKKQLVLYKWTTNQNCLILLTLVKTDLYFHPITHSSNN